MYTVIYYFAYITHSLCCCVSAVGTHSLKWFNKLLTAPRADIWYYFAYATSLMAFQRFNCTLAHYACTSPHPWLYFLFSLTRCNNILNWFGRRSLPSTTSIPIRHIKTSSQLLFTSSQSNLIYEQVPTLIVSGVFMHASNPEKGHICVPMYI